MKKKIIIILIGYFLLQDLVAQDPVFTQFYAAPIILNPAFSGSLGNTRLGIGYRDQWNGGNYKLSTIYASADKWVESINSGIGLTILNQNEELTNYNFTQFNLSYSFHIKLSEKFTFFPGISFGYSLKQYNFQGLIFGDQINIYDGSISGTSDDAIFENNKVHFFDLSVGGVLYAKNAWLGISLRHLTEPDISFISSEELPLSMYLSIHGGYRFSLNTEYKEPKKSYLFLTFNYMNQDKYNRFDFGAEFEISKFYFGALASTVIYQLSEESQTLLSINPLVGIEFKKFKIGLSYDIPTSDIGNIANTIEITIQYYIKNSPSSDSRKRLWQVKN